MRAAQWRLLGLVLGVALGAAALLVDAGLIERLVAATGLDRLTPYAQPPLGQKARGALALGLVVLGLALGWILGRVFGTKADAGEELPEADVAQARAAGTDRADLVASPAAQVGQSAPVSMAGWRTPTDVAAPDGPAIGLAQTAGVAPPPEIEARADVPGMTRVAEPEVVPLPAARVGLAGTANDVTANPESPKEEAAVDNSPALARIEAMVAEMARHGPPGFDSRFDAIEARLQQMAQQMIEIAALARAQQRTPVAAPLPTRDARPPADPAQRRVLSQAARELRARLGDAELV